MANIQVNFSQTKGKIKPMHGVGQPPFVGVDFEKFHFLQDAGIPFSRLHDVGGGYGGFRFVDIPNLFRDFDADPTDPDAYDFTFTDLLVTALVKQNIEPFFRLGVTIENQAEIKAYRIFPPKDYLKWAKICEGVIRHYTEGWANGFHYNIRYWEIWNEPDFNYILVKNQMWRGSREDFYEFYGVASKYLKNCFPHLKIGGYASCGFSGAIALANGETPSERAQYWLDFFHGFLKYAKENACPLDYFSWHSYGSIESTANIQANYVRNKLDAYGFVNTETICNEWNVDFNLRGTLQHAAEVTGMMLAFQDSPLDSAMFYDARFGTSIYGGMFNPLTGEPFPAYYGFKAFNELYKRGNQIALECDTEGLYAVAAVGETDKCIVIANTTEQDLPLNLSMDGQIKECLLLDESHMYIPAEFNGTIGSASVLCMMVS